MNMKKAFAGVLASVVAISAMATTMVSATNAKTYTEAQKAYTKTWDFTGKSYPVTWTGTALFNLGGAYVQAHDVADVVTFTFSSAVDSATLSLTGEVTVGATKSTQTKNIKLKKVSDTVYTLTLQAGASTTTAGVFPVGYFNDGAIISDLSYEVKSTYATKKLADAAAEVAKNITATATQGDVTDGALSDVITAAYPDNTAIVGNEGKVGTADTTHGPVLFDFDNDDNGTLYMFEHDLGGKAIWFMSSLMTDEEIVDKTTELELYGFQNMVMAIQNEIGDAKGATLTFNLYTEDDADEKTPDSIDIDADTIAPLADGSDGENFSIAVNYNASRKFTKGQKVADDATKITFNWDDITKGLAAGTIFDMAIRISDGKAFQIDSVVIDVPAKTLADLSAGEAAQETTVALETTAAATEAAATEAAATTAAATNPTTGNAPIALAVIPVAIIAAAVVAKKRG